MYKKILIAASFITLLSSSIGFVYAEENQGEEIEKVINNFLACIPSKNLDCIMAQISPNYSDKTGGVEIDYAKFKAVQDEFIKNVSVNYINVVLSDIKTSNLVIENDKAALELEFTQKSHSLDTFKTETIVKKYSVALEKIESGWKITKWKRINIRMLE